MRFCDASWSVTNAEPPRWQKCMQPTWKDSLYCNACFVQKWGPDETNSVALPLCLFGIVIEYWNIDPKECENVDFLRFVLRFVKPKTAARVMHSLLTSSNVKHDTLALLADYYGYSSVLWTCLKKTSRETLPI